MSADSDLTRDTPAPGVVIWQPRRGFRYGAEAFWLAGFALEGPPARTAVDLGTGSGIVAMLLASRGLDVVGYDLRPEWQACWDRTLADSAVRARLAVRDVGTALPAVDLVVSNPPFYAAGAGPAARDPWKAAARTESTATLAGFVAAATVGARACFVVPRARERDLVAAAPAGWVARRVVRVGRVRVLVELGPGDPGTPSEVSEAEAARWYAPFR